MYSFCFIKWIEHSETTFRNSAVRYSISFFQTAPDTPASCLTPETYSDIAVFFLIRLRF